MNRYEARAFIDEVRDLLHKAANATGPLGDRVEARLLEIEAQAVDMLAGDLHDFAITTAGAGQPVGAVAGDGAPDAAYVGVRLEPVVEIEHRPGAKIIAGETLAYEQYIARGAPYEAPDGRTVRDSCTSGPEGFIRTADGPKPFGAASALVARLLEPLAAGAL